MTPISRRHAAFSLVELLTVIAIIAVLVGLLLPAVQSTRENSRRASCVNNLRQLALGSLAYESSLGHLPSGGWAFQWTGDPDAGLGSQQPGGWAYQVLPFIEHQSVFELGTDGTAPRGNPFNRANSAPQKDGAVARARAAVACFVCPSRRGVGTLPCTPFNTAQNSGTISESGGLDYAGNAGANAPVATYGNNNAWTDANYAVATDVIPTYKPTGVIFPCSRIEAAQIRDGLSLTLLLGEYNRHPEDYSTALANPFGGAPWSTSVSGLQADSANVPGIYPASGYNFRPFGSAHATSCHFAFCDGSVRPIAYDITPAVRSSLCNRADGQTPDLPGF